MNTTPLCDVTGCGQYADVWIHDVKRCRKCYLRELDAVGKSAPVGRAVLEHGIQLGLTDANAGETLSQYMARHGIDKRALRVYERVPGSDDT